MASIERQIKAAKKEFHSEYMYIASSAYRMGLISILTDFPKNALTRDQVDSLIAEINAEDEKRIDILVHAVEKNFSDDMLHKLRSVLNIS